MKKNCFFKKKTPAFLPRSLSFMDSIGSASLQNDTRARERPVVNYACL